MELQVEKERLINQLEQVNDLSLIRAARELLESFSTQKKDKAVGYEVGGKPISQKELVLDAIEAEKGFQHREYIDHQDLKKEMEQW